MIIAKSKIVFFEEVKELASKEDAAKAARAEYYRNWRARNKERVRRYNEAYWRRKAEKNGGETDAETTSTE